MAISGSVVAQLVSRDLALPEQQEPISDDGTATAAPPSKQAKSLSNVEEPV